MSSSTARRPARGLALVLGSVPVIVVGLLLVTYALLRAPWPSDPYFSGWKMVSHLDRIRGEQSPPQGAVIIEGQDKTPAWYGRRVMDVIVLLMLVAGYVSVVLAVWRNNARPLIFLTVIGGLGVFYSAFVGLYLGPILTMVGFSLVFFGASLGWASIHHRKVETAFQIGTTDGTHSTA